MSLPLRPILPPFNIPDGGPFDQVEMSINVPMPTNIAPTPIAEPGILLPVADNRIRLPLPSYRSRPATLSHSGALVPDLRRLPGEAGKCGVSLRAQLGRGDGVEIVWRSCGGQLRNSFLWALDFLPGVTARSGSRIRWRGHRARMSSPVGRAQAVDAPAHIAGMAAPSAPEMRIRRVPASQLAAAAAADIAVGIAPRTAVIFFADAELPHHGGRGVGCRLLRGNRSNAGQIPAMIG